MAIKDVAFWLIPLFFLFIGASIFYFDMFPQAKERIMWVYDTFVPEISIGDNELHAGTTEFAPSQRHEMDSLKATLLSLASERAGKNCFAAFTGFQEDLGTDASTASLQFDYNHETDSTRVTIKKSGQVIHSQFNVPKLKPCVIAGWSGDSPTAKTFLKKVNDQFWLSDDHNQRTPGAYMYKVDTFHIQYSQNRRNGNRLYIDNPYPDPVFVNDESRNFESNGLLFKGEDNEVCFFPTNWVYRADEDGIDNDQFTDSNNPSTLIYKWNKGELPACSTQDSYEAISVAGTMYASDGEMDCLNSNNGEPLTATTRKVTVSAQYNSLISNQNMDIPCRSLLPSGSGCPVFLNSRERTNADGSACGAVRMRSGEVIPATNAPAGTKPYTEVPAFSETSAACLVTHGEWFNRDDNTLLCNKEKWEVCGQSQVGKKIELPIGLGPDKATYECQVRGSLHTWSRVVGTLPWITYRGIELYGEEDPHPYNNNYHTEYPSECNIVSGRVSSTCDVAGKMGLVNSEGTKFPCYSEDLDCSDESDVEPEFPGWDSPSQQGCQAFISGEEFGVAAVFENSCGHALVAYGTHIPLEPRRGSDLYNCIDQETCPEGPSKINFAFNSRWSLCLLKHQWGIPIHEMGEYLCAPSSAGGVWHVCEPRVEGKCLDVPTLAGSQHWCCQKSNKGYEFIPGQVS